MNYYDFAIKNLNTAQLLVEHSGDTDEIVVSCQQYFEKAFKQLLLLRDGSIYKTHKISFLVEKLSIAEFSVNDDLFRIIEDYYYEKGYPNEFYEETSKQGALKVYNLAVELKPIIEYYLKEFENDKKGTLKKSSAFDDV